MTGIAAELSRCPTPQELMDMAASQTGVDDFGDPARNAGLAALVESIERGSWQ